MFKWLVNDGLTVGQVTDRLNEAGIKSRNAHQSKHGGRWSHVVVRRVLSNPTLHPACFIWGEPGGGSTDSRSHKTKVDRNGKPLHGEPRKIELGNPVFTASEFRFLNRALARHPRTDSIAAPQVRQMLSTRLYGECGKHYIGVQIKGKDYDVYRCSGRRHRGTGTAAERCQCKQVNAQKLDARVWTEVQGLLSDPARLQAMARQWLELDDAEDTTSETVSRSLSDQVRKLERALDRAKNTVLLDDDPEDARLRAERFKAQLAKARATLDAVEALRVDAQAKADRLMDLSRLVERAKVRLASMEVAVRREVLDLLGVSVVMGDLIESEPQVLTVQCQIDPKMFVSESETPSNPKYGAPGGGGVLGPRGRAAEVAPFGVPADQHLGVGHRDPLTLGGGSAHSGGGLRRGPEGESGAHRQHRLQIRDDRRHARLEPELRALTVQGRTGEGTVQCGLALRVGEPGQLR